MLNTAHSQAPSAVRDEVLRQHEILRDLLHRAINRTTATVQRPRGDTLELAHMVHEIRRCFRAHVSFEERVLVPVLASTDGWGPERVRNLLEEHALQRQQLDALLDGLEAGWERARLAAVVRALAADILRDMAEEERDYLGPELLDDWVVIGGTRRE